MYRILDAVVPHLPVNKPVYLMGVGTPANIIHNNPSFIKQFRLILYSFSNLNATVPANSSVICRHIPCRPAGEAQSLQCEV